MNTNTNFMSRQPVLYKTAVLVQLQTWDVAAVPIGLFWYYTLTSTLIMKHRGANKSIQKNAKLAGIALASHADVRDKPKNVCMDVLKINFSELTI